MLRAEEDRVVAQRELAAQYPQLVVKDWREMQPQVAEIVDLVDATMAIWFLIMSALTFGLVNTLIATVMQRTRELGMLRALGMNQRLSADPSSDGMRRHHGGGCNRRSAARCGHGPWFRRWH